MCKIEGKGWAASRPHPLHITVAVLAEPDQTGTTPLSHLSLPYSINDCSRWPYPISSFCGWGKNVRTYRTLPRLGARDVVAIQSALVSKGTLTHAT